MGDVSIDAPDAEWNAGVAASEECTKYADGLPALAAGLRTEVQRLTAEVEELDQGHARQDTELATLMDQRRELRFQVEAMKTERAALKAEVERLRGMPETAYREGFRDGADHERIPARSGHPGYGYPDEDGAWAASTTHASLEAPKKAG
jgi:hypothetical protein